MESKPRPSADAQPKTETRRISHGDGLHPLDLDSAYENHNAPLDLDVGFGKGRFLLARAAVSPAVRFLGIERRLDRLRRVDRKVCRRGLSNVRLLRFDAWYAVIYLVPAAAVRNCFIFFPDPWPKARHHAHRFFDDGFVQGLFRILQPGGVVQTATDHLPYAEEIHAALARHPGFEPAEVLVPAPEERTDFELLYLGKTPIGRCAFRKVADA